MSKINIAIIVRQLETIKDNLPKRQAYPEVVVMMEKKRASLEEQFLDALQYIRWREGASERFGMYNNWYKKYKGVEA